jgi:hypothetical protein
MTDEMKELAEESAKAEALLQELKPFEEAWAKLHLRSFEDEWARVRDLPNDELAERLRRHKDMRELEADAERLGLDAGDAA